jgi:hypothetical protein
VCVKAPSVNECFILMSSLLWETPGTPYQVFCKYSRRVGNELRGLEGSVKWSVFYKPATTINLGVKEVSDVIVSTISTSTLIK